MNRGQLITYKQHFTVQTNPATSTIVHGGGDKEIDKALKSGDFNNLQSLCDYLETNFRTVLLWLALKDAKDRPYRKRNGWEELIWSK